RCVLAAFLVTSGADSGPGTLRDAITQANLGTGGDTVSFAANIHNIALQSSLTISQGMTITGPGAVPPGGLSCQACGGFFRPKRRDAVYCSPACRQRAYRKRVTDKRPDVEVPPTPGPLTRSPGTPGGRARTRRRP